ncbi:MAG: SDR family NAD(P)-dependent oxidoreductase, partial [Zetaproteobacteria bacterium]
VTGASGGLGHAFARALARRGWALLLHGRRRAAMEALAHELPTKTEIATGDLRDARAREALITVAKAKRIAGFVNNAGLGYWGGFADLAWERHEEVLCVDLVAAMSLAHALVPALCAARGFLINVSSLAGEHPLPFMSSYAAAKAGLTAFSESLRAELRRKLAVVTLAPGPSPTGFRRISGMPKGPGGLFSTPPEVVVEKAIAMAERGGGFCVPGVRHKALFWLARLVPRGLGARVLARRISPERLEDVAG